MRIALVDPYITYGPHDVHESALGGTETSFVLLAEALHARAHDVVVYLRSVSSSEYEGVEYRSVRELGTISHDAMLGRWPELFENLGDRCGKRVWWCHKAVDLDSIRRAQMVGAVPVVTSQYQASQLLDLGWSGQFAVIPLACRIRPSHQQRNPRVAVWSSAFERGLELLIQIWRGIRRDLPPGSRLEIAGGPHVYREYGGYLVEVERSLRQDTCDEPDIVWLGALNPRQLTIMLSSGGILPYPCNVAESFCLSVLEAQAAGCIPIVTPCGALPERVVHGKTGWIEAEPRIGGRIVEYFRAADSPLVEEMRRAAREAAEALTWDRVACQFQLEVLTQ